MFSKGFSVGVVKSGDYAVMSNSIVQEKMLFSLLKNPQTQTSLKTK